MFIATYDRETNLISFPYEIADEARYHTDPFLLGPGLTSTVIRSARPLRFGSEAELATRDLDFVASGPDSASWLGVPMIGADGVTGVIALESLEPNAYSEADERLLSTLATTLGVALEGARLLDQTRQRNAELAVVNSVQAGLAAELDMQAMYDLVGDKIAEIFDTHVVDIGTYDREMDLIRFPYGIERGVRLYDEPLPPWGFRKHVLETGEPLLIDDLERQAAQYDNPPGTDVRGAGEVTRVRAAHVGRPADRRRLAPEPRPRARVRPGRPGPARDAGDEPRRRARERPPDRRDPPPRRRAGDHQRDRNGPLRRARDEGDVRARRRARPGAVPGRRDVHRDVRPRDEPDHVPLRDRERRAVPHGADRARPGRDLDRDRDGEAGSIRIERRGRRARSDQRSGARPTPGSGCRWSAPRARSASSRWRVPRPTPSARPTSASWARSPRTSPWPSRARACFDETRRGSPSWRSSTRSARRSRASSR